MSFLMSSFSHYLGLTIDIAIVITLLCFAIVGYKKGFLKSVIALFSTLVVLILAVYFANHFAKLINSIYDFTKLIAKKITPSIEKIDSIYSTTFPEGLSGKEFYSKYISDTGTNSVVKRFFEYALSGFSASEIAGLKVSEVLAGSVASLIMTIVAGILLFVLIKIALNLLSRLFDNISSSKIFGGVNKIFGFVFGAVKGSVVIIFLILLTIAVSFVPKANKKIYPLVQNDTYITKAVYNVCDKYVEKYVIDTDLISKWINNLWDNRNLDPVTTPTIEERAETLEIDFIQEGTVYTKVFEDYKATSSDNYYRLNKIEGITNENVTIIVSFEYTSSDTFSFELFSINDTDNSIIKSATSHGDEYIYESLGYTDYILKLSSSGNEIITKMTITINTENA